ncbi:RNA polymerase sigma factor [Alicyclobacillus sp. SO9]|uniref:RNA polymerase sigma factor n=1 Tax=Alicyclobacillus sp. SO9 TaxID=2665646 RepID=UPI0018E88BFA|nr:RNA polymerase sigma factor [Alicyclobacillus sp. SO9]QQE80008.1 RNA polymerase sigma factor [Alicyclobacillus sp. SO9]
MESLSPKEAASVLFERHGDEVYRYIRYTIGNVPQADDILQEVFLRVLQSWHRFQHQSTPKTWLWAIAKNCIRDYFRSSKRTNQQVPLDEQLLDETSGDYLLKLQLEDSLQSLSVAHREVFVERIIHDKSTEETAQTLGWSASKVKTTLHRAMKQIRKSLAEGGHHRG